MNLKLIAEDVNLLEEAKSIQYFDQVSLTKNIDELEGDCIVISDTLIPYQDIPNLDISNAKHVFYKLSSDADPTRDRNVKILCDSRGIVLLGASMLPSQVVEAVISHLNDRRVVKDSTVFMFLSPIGNTGTTTVTLSVAQSLQQHTNSKVGVLLLNAYDDGTDQMDYKGTRLDEMKARLTNELIASEEEFISYFHKVKEGSLYVLGGNKNIRMERLFTEQEIHYLIEKAKESFDVILIDAGSHFDNALMAQALLESDLKFLVANQQFKGVKKFNYIYNDILYPLGLKREEFLLILNKYIDVPQLPSSKDIAKELDVTMLATILDNSLGFITEKEQKSLYDYDVPEYKAGVDIISRSIAMHIGEDFVETNNDLKKGIFGNFFKKKG